MAVFILHILGQRDFRPLALSWYLWLEDTVIVVGGVFSKHSV